MFNPLQIKDLGASNEPTTIFTVSRSKTTTYEELAKVEFPAPKAIHEEASVFMVN